MWKEIEGLSVGVFDAETDGFLNDMTTMHCMTIIDAATRHEWKSEDYELRKYLAVLDTFDVLVGHNIIGFDLPMLKKHFNWEPKPHVLIIDTLWLSRMYYPDIEGGHSLDAWGQRLGNKKTEYYPVFDPEQPHYNEELLLQKQDAEAKGRTFKFDAGWNGSVVTQMMQSYCDQDVRVNVDAWHKLTFLLKNFSFQSIMCEMNTATLIQRQMQHGFVFDMVGAEKLHAELVERVIELEDEVHETFKPIPKFIRVVQPRVKKDGTVSSVGLKKLPDWETSVPAPEYRDVDVGELIPAREYTSGSFSLIEWPEFSLGSRAQIAERLLRAGYKGLSKTDKGNYIIDDAALQLAADAGIPEAKPLAEYFLIQKREAMVKDWIAKAIWHEDQGVYRIHGYVNSMGANSNRMTHSSPNVAQVPSAHSPYGDRCRSLFTVRKGYRLVGCDASGLELRTLAHYMGDDEYTKTLLEGDIHTANQMAAGLPTRNNAKTFIYGFLYGAGDAKIGEIVGGGAKEGKALKVKFLNSLPALKRLREGVLKAAKDRGWLKGFDGRILRVRSPHSALNTLLQGMGAIVMKYWLIEVARHADAEGLDWAPSANVHDEGQFEVLEAHVPRFKEICEQAFLTISAELGSKCLLEGEAMDGSTWLETH
jgi:hypothetical protein